MKAPRFRSNPEATIQENIRAFLELRGWFVRETHGNAFQKGFPDLFCWHPQYGMRWIDCKNPDSFAYTKAQCQDWPKWEAGGVGIWIMFAATEPAYRKLFDAPNFRDYWKPRYDRYNQNIDDVVSDIRED